MEVITSQTQNIWMSHLPYAFNPNLTLKVELSDHLSLHMRIGFDIITLMK